MNPISRKLGCLLLSGAVAQFVTAAPTVEKTTVLGPFTGDQAQLHPDNIAPHKIEYYGTDLGITYEHKGQIHFLFGDTWATEAYAPIERASGPRLDDMYGMVAMKDWPDPSKISSDNMPLLKIGQLSGSTEVAAMDPGYAMDLGKTPIFAFSNGEDQFAGFFLGKPLGCMTDSDCENGLSCDNGMGYIGPKYTEEENFTVSCVDGTPFCMADTMTAQDGQAVKGSGFCVDKTTTNWADTPTARRASTGLKVRVAVRDKTNPKKFIPVTDWNTNKFFNTTASTIESFIPENGGSYKNQNYNIAKGTGENQRVFLWGRPGFISVKAKGRSLGQYFAYVDMPKAPSYDWKVNYYTGTDENGIPQFSSSEAEAKPVDMDSTQPGIQGEIHDDINQQSIVWIDHIKKWVMFDGGGLITLPRPPFLPKCGVLEAFIGDDCTDVDLENGAIRMRTADNPWGPWTPSQDVIVGGDPNVIPVEHQYGPGGMLRHPACTEESCAPHTDTQYYNKDEYGFFYCPNIVEQWITPVGDSVDVIWIVSTWDPYRVVLLRTRIKP